MGTINSNGKMIHYWRCCTGSSKNVCYLWLEEMAVRLYLESFSLVWCFMTLECTSVVFFNTQDENRCDWVQSSVVFPDAYKLFYLNMEAD